MKLLTLSHIDPKNETPGTLRIVPNPQHFDKDSDKKKKRREKGEYPTVLMPPQESQYIKGPSYDFL
jgi:hypothetical protein